ncbi:hypothetical protein CEXT_571471 [Caerostris extrusa]|uniref:Uncharacterized protein n=1 Tax=Caerostris extrusa TaxID=172846 RepID=A0AAV4R869_CAEEX|nr:hypothetical protein CEXT_571471 [Caerostris extrusa]
MRDCSRGRLRRGLSSPGDTPPLTIVREAMSCARTRSQRSVPDALYNGGQFHLKELAHPYAKRGVRGWGGGRRLICSVESAWWVALQIGGH